MSHPENKTTIQILLEQQEGITRESIRMAERLLAEGAANLSFENREAKERYLSAVPYMAMEIKGVVSQLISVSDGHSSKQLDRIVEGAAEVLRELKLLNDKAGKENA